MAAKYLIVTDPSYILPEDIWDKCCNEAAYSSELFDECISKALSEFSGAKAWAHSTGFGDWSNSMSGPAIVQDRFCADSGMVCVCQCTEPVGGKLEDLPAHCFAVIDVDRSEVTVNFNMTVSDWCVVEIKALDDTGEWHSEYPDE